MQAELNIMCLIKGPSQITEEQVCSFGDTEDEALNKAIQWSWNHRRVKDMTKKRASELAGMQHSHFTNMVNGKKHLPPAKINAFEWAVGNTAVSQTILRFREIRKKEMAASLAALIVGELAA